MDENFHWSYITRNGYNVKIRLINQEIQEQNKNSLRLKTERKLNTKPGQNVSVLFQCKLHHFQAILSKQENTYKQMLIKVKLIWLNAFGKHIYSKIIKLKQRFNYCYFFYKCKVFQVLNKKVNYKL